MSCCVRGLQVTVSVGDGGVKQLSSTVQKSACNLIILSNILLSYINGLRM